VAVSRGRLHDREQPETLTTAAAAPETRTLDCCHQAREYSASEPRHHIETLPQGSKECERKALSGHNTPWTHNTIPSISQAPTVPFPPSTKQSFPPHPLPVRRNTHVCHTVVTITPGKPLDGNIFSWPTCQSWWSSTQQVGKRGTFLQRESERTLRHRDR
jgi:hypothetical protein